jgi:hypothetical protein
MRPKITAILFIPMLFLLTAAAFVLAQQTGSISGRILDSQTQLPLAGVSVHVVGTSRGANTDLDGKFSILRLAPATYSLRITQIGYTSVELKNIEVKPGLNSEVNTSLTTAKESLDEKITVEAELDFVDKFEVSGKSTVTRSEQQNSPTEFAEVPTAKEKRIEYKLQSQTIVCDSIARVNRSPKHQSFDRPCYPTNPYSQGFEDMIFEDYGTNPFVLASEDYQSTFAIDIDDASYVLTRSFLSRSELPPSEAVRVEEFINHFNYNYEPPSEDVFNIFMEGSPSRFGSNSKILRIGIQGKEIDVESRKPSNVTFVVDVSGSMNESNKYSLVIEALKHIINHLYVSDRVCIVSYNQHAKVILKPISLRYRTKILSSLDKLRPYGSTNVEAGLKLGYNGLAKF